MIYTYPNEILLKPSVDVTLEEGKEIDKLLREEIKNLDWGNCVGLAAPQIGLNKNVFVALDKTYINPKILWYNNMRRTFLEGCFSLVKNKTDYEVERSIVIKVEFTNLKGKVEQKTFMGFQAQVFQHEYDHLQGKLCCGDSYPQL